MCKNPFTNKKFIKNQFTFFTIAVQVFLCVLLNLIENLQLFFNFYERFFIVQQKVSLCFVLLYFFKLLGALLLYQYIFF